MVVVPKGKIFTFKTAEELKEFRDALQRKETAYARKRRKKQKRRKHG